MLSMGSRIFIFYFNVKSHFSLHIKVCTSKILISCRNGMLFKILGGIYRSDSKPLLSRYTFSLFETAQLSGDHPENLKLVFVSYWLFLLKFCNINLSFRNSLRTNKRIELNTCGLSKIKPSLKWNKLIKNS